MRNPLEDNKQEYLIRVEHSWVASTTPLRVGRYEDVVSVEAQNAWEALMQTLRNLEQSDMYREGGKVTIELLVPLLDNRS